MALLPDIDPQEILTEIVNLGYDTDTVGAIAGSILGARFGCDWIPLDRLKDLERLERYAKALVTQSNDIETSEEFFKAEMTWTKLERGTKKELVSKWGRPKKKLNQRQREIANKLKKKGTTPEKKKKEEEEDKIKEEEVKRKEEEEEDEGDKVKTTTYYDCLSMDD